MDIPLLDVIHLPLFWRNGNKQTISVGLKEELQLFTLSDSKSKRHLLLFKEGEVDSHLHYSNGIPYEKVEDSEIIVTMQVDTGGSAPSGSYKTTIKKILEATSQNPI